jgi:excisionase family DNA binding protein
MVDFETQRDIWMERDQLWTVNEVAKRLALRPSTIRKFIFQRRLPVVRLGRAVRVRESDLARLIADGTLSNDGKIRTKDRGNGLNDLVVQKQWHKE